MTSPQSMPTPGKEESERRWCAEPGCRVPDILLHTSAADGQTWCNSHDPDPVVAEARRLGQARGALKTQLRFKRGLDADELGSLTTAEDAKRWSAVIATAAACGRITPSQANAAIRAVHEFLVSHDQDVKENELADLKRDVAVLKRGTR